MERTEQTISTDTPPPETTARVNRLLTNVVNTLEQQLSTGTAPQHIDADALEQLLAKHARIIHGGHCAAVHQDVLAALECTGRPDGPVLPRSIQRRIELCLVVA